MHIVVLMARLINSTHQLEFVAGPHPMAEEKYCTYIAISEATAALFSSRDALLVGLTRRLN